MFKNSITTEIKIKSNIEDVWKELINFQEYKNWNPAIYEVSGNIKENETIKIVVNTNGSKMVFKPKILKYKENCELRWLGRLFIPKIFDGEHYFIVKDNLDGTTTFIHGENFSGVLIPFFGKMISNTKKGFEAMNQELKKRVENDL
ncbi:SRPBCC domain-containing protein [Aliarcobacter skirrowii]|uniref:SRPBCC domain-containing protein n=1 Tax=Aliarcobacter skirrowii TaxID=28200 RepID=UPI0029BF425E|nr:SRPBCC domain-containing protein [Aliarcobacter skirrowii]MDX3959790.1 SRPBCC domain-containing protein [Aliarcobacter skirrowii]MDX4058638.1 SRPBCC domain-containing protein [Aliarcobacter skirrowii]